MIQESPLITPNKEFPSRLVEDAYGTLAEIAPSYRQGLEEFTGAWSNKRKGWGIRNSEGKIIFPQLFTGRSCCIFATEMLGTKLKRKYPNLVVQLLYGYYHNYDSSPNSPNTNGWTADHVWGALADPETLDDVPVGEKLITWDPTAKQVNPNFPFIHFTTTSDPGLSQYIKDDGFLINPDSKEPGKLYLDFSFDAVNRYRQRKAYKDFLNVLGLL